MTRNWTIEKSRERSEIQLTNNKEKASNCIRRFLNFHSSTTFHKSLIRIFNKKKLNIQPQKFNKIVQMYSNWNIPTKKKYHKIEIMTKQQKTKIQREKERLSNENLLNSSYYFIRWAAAWMKNFQKLYKRSVILYALFV